MSSTRNDEQVLDLILLGLSWLHERVPETPGWTGNGILRTMRQCGAASDAQYHIIARDPSDSLRREAVARSQMVWPNQRRQLHRILAASNRHVAVLVTAPAHMRFLATPPFYSELILKPEGYLLQATMAGRRYAHEIAQHYSPLTADTFWGHWLSHRRGMKAMHAVRRPTTSEA